MATLSYASNFLADVTAPTLVIHHRDAELTTVQTARRLSEEIADVRLVEFAGRGVSTDVELVLSVVNDFLAEEDDWFEAEDVAPGRLSSREGRHEQTDEEEPEWDVFISHASEDKEAVAQPLKKLLEARNVKVWIDDNELKLGDSLRAKIDYGLANSRYGVVILSESFFEKDWPVRELSGLATREAKGRKVVLPVWHGVDHQRVSEFSPTLADRKAVSTVFGLDPVVDAIMRVLHHD